MIKAGVIGFKGYLIDSGIEEFPNVEETELDAILTTLNGSDIVLAVRINYLSLCFLINNLYRRLTV